MAKRPREVLGKGIHALIAEYPQGTDGESQLLDIAIEQIEPNPYQPRREFDEEALVELESSIREKGILQVEVEEVSEWAREFVSGRGVEGLLAAHLGDPKR